MPGPAESAIKEIAETLRSARYRGRAAHLLIGAGCSKSAGIPLASEIVREIRENYPEHFRRAFGDGAGTYGGCMKFLTVNERRDLLSPYLTQARVNWGHLAIAQMMAEGIVDRVLTVNFDNLLARAVVFSVSTQRSTISRPRRPTTARFSSPGNRPPPRPGLRRQAHEHRGGDLRGRAPARPHRQAVPQRASAHRRRLQRRCRRPVLGLREDHRDQEKLYWLGRGDTASAHVRGFTEGS